jgi:hypothetical protein
VAQEAIARARRGDGPTLIEAETYRFRGHSLADPDELRSKEEKAKYQVGVATRPNLERAQTSRCRRRRRAVLPSLHLLSTRGVAPLDRAARRPGDVLTARGAAVGGTRVIVATVGLFDAKLLNPFRRGWPRLCPLQARDPIPQLKAYMLKNGLATEADIKELEEKVGTSRAGLGAATVDRLTDSAAKPPAPAAKAC